MSTTRTADMEPISAVLLEGCRTMSWVEIGDWLVIRGWAKVVCWRLLVSWGFEDTGSFAKWPAANGTAAPSKYLFTAYGGSQQLTNFWPAHFEIGIPCLRFGRDDDVCTRYAPAAPAHWSACQLDRLFGQPRERLAACLRAAIKRQALPSGKQDADCDPTRILDVTR